MRDRRDTTVERVSVRRGGFTLLETALATVIIGVGVLALVEAQQSFMRSNAWSTHTATGTYLAGEIRELMRKLPKHDPVTGLYTDNAGILRGWGPEPGEVTLADFDDVDDFDMNNSNGLTISFDGTPSLDDNDLPGPVDAFGTIIPEIQADGSFLRDNQDLPMPLQGWSQIVRVEKIFPFDTSQVVADNATVAPSPPDFEGIDVGGFPLRVTVTTRYQGQFDAAPSDVATVSWIVP